MLDAAVKEKIKQFDVAKLLQEMLRFNTTNAPGNEQPLAEMIAELIKQHGFEVDVDVFTENRANVTGRMKGSGERPALLFNGHLDVVPVGEMAWDHDPFAGVIADGKVYGRGSSDMKGGLAAMLVAAFAVHAAGKKLKGDLVFAGSAGEETDSVGAKLFVKKNGLDGIGAIVVGEPSSCGINVAEKGALWVQVTTKGKTAHGAFPHEGKNAILAMNAVLNKLSTYKFKITENALLSPPTMNISTIQGGVKTNVVPDRCVLTIDIRTVPGINHDDVVNEIRELCNQIKQTDPDFDADVEAINDRPAVETSSDHPFVKMAQEVIKEEFGKDVTPKGVNFFTDAAIFLPPTGLPAILYGPGDASMAHQPNEHVSIKHLEEAVHFYAALIQRYLID